MDISLEKIIVAKTAGFCMGVQRAVDIALTHIDSGATPIFTLGELVHNPSVNKMLVEKGVQNITSIPVVGIGTIIIRAHGARPQAKQALLDSGFTLVDATCPKVAKVQEIIAGYAAQDYAVIIIGEKDHPEIVGLLGYAYDSGHVVKDLAELALLPTFNKAVLVAQTTLDMDLFEAATTYVRQSLPHYKVENTICGATEKRQRELKEMTPQVDAFVIVGGFNSGNTRRLNDIALATGKPVVFIEDADGLNTKNFAKLKDAKNIGLTAGASTPLTTINAVKQKIQKLTRSVA